MEIQMKDYMMHIEKVQYKWKSIEYKYEKQIDNFLIQINKLCNIYEEIYKYKIT